MSLNPSASVSNIPGVGPKTLAELSKINISSYLDLLLHLPIRYQDRSKIELIQNLLTGTEVLIDGRIISSTVTYKGRRALEVRVEDESASMALRFFFFSKQQQAAFASDSWIRAFGIVKPWGKSITMIHPEYTLYKDPPGVPEKKLTPVYALTKGITQNKIRRLTQKLTKLDWPNDAGEPYEKLSTLHSPPSDIKLIEIERIQNQIALDELTAHYLISKQRQNERQNQKATPLPQSFGLGKILAKRLGFKLTQSQAKVTKEIFLDLERPSPMLRLLQGDVGSGKTIIAAFAAIRAIEQRGQTALLAPTELLAEQHFNNFSEWLKPLDIQVCLLTGKTPKKELGKLLKDIETGTSNLIIGTHAIFQNRVTFKNLVLTLIDEQHRFGVHQRMALLDKSPAGLHPHQLIMTATPIPRTLTMALYGDMEVSIIDELPKGRKPIETRLKNSQDRTFLLNKIETTIKKRQQIYWVCTIIEESDTVSATSAISLHKELTNLMPHWRIGLLHGQLKSQDKIKIMSEFKAHKIDLLVATTIIEVGVDVPNATLMIIENANRLGLAQLHQLRGRIGRGSIASECLLLGPESNNSTSSRRLEVMSESQDGFYLAEQDLKLRGPGDLLGTRQSGEESFRMADLSVHSHLIPKAINRGELLIASEREESKKEIDNLLSLWARKKSEMLRT